MFVNGYWRIPGHFGDLVNMVALVKHLADETATGSAPGDVMRDA